MKRILVTLAILALFPLLAGCGLFGFENWEWNQRLVLEVETPEGVVSNGSIVEVRASRDPEWLLMEGAGGIRSDVRGEASFVEVAPGRYLFALLSGGGEAQMARNLFFPDRELSNAEAYQKLEDFAGSSVLARESYPRLVTFTDIADPETVRRVDPDDLAASFGPGYRLKSMTLEITDEPVTKGAVERVLGWMSDQAALDAIWKTLDFQTKTSILGLRKPIRR